MSTSSPTASLQTVLGLSHGRLRQYASVLHQASDPVSLVVALRAAAETVRVAASPPDKATIAWTFPGTSRPGLRTTGGVAREIIEASERRLLVVGYSVTHDPAYTGLAGQTIRAMAEAAARGVVVTAVLHREANRHALLAAWSPGIARPSIFTWPVSDDEMASVHAKILVADRADALVTSANLTYHGFERNFELGVRITGQAAAEIYDRVYGLISAGEFTPWDD